MEIEGGHICFYPSKNCFEAHCGNPDHGRCVLTRGNGYRHLRAASSADLAPLKKGGRPLGFLVAWLSKSFVATTRAEHWSLEMMMSDLVLRTIGRLTLQDSLDGRNLATRERPRDLGEESEPESLGGYEPLVDESALE
jgi:hypothetical protein